MMYSCVIAAVAESADPSWRSSAVGSYRFWRDLGYAVGGLLLGYVTDQAGTFVAVLVSAFLMVGVIVNFVYNYEEVVEGEIGMEKLTENFANAEFVIEDEAEKKEDAANAL